MLHDPAGFKYQYHNHEKPISYSISLDSYDLEYWWLYDQGYPIPDEQQ